MLRMFQRSRRPARCCPKPRSVCFVRTLCLLLLVPIVGCPTPDPVEPIGPEPRDLLSERPDSTFCAPLDADGVFAPLLSDTGCFSDGMPAGDLVPYTVRSPLWTDGADKERWLALPVGQFIGYSVSGDWSFPEASVLAKNFLRGPGDPIETRLMVRWGSGWDFASYRWEGGVASLLDDSLEEPVTLADGTESDWFFPGTDLCVSCHADGAIGPTAAQLDTDYDYDGVVRSQLDEMARVGLFDIDPAPPEPLARPSEEAVDLEDRARSWLHGNCAHCHRPGGWAPPDMDMDLRAQIPLAQARLCGVPVQFDTAPEAGSYRLSPGDSGDSALWGRTQSDGLMRMPPVGVSVIDPLGAELLLAWIDSREDCP
jgi:hypothetical protein